MAFEKLYETTDAIRKVYDEAKSWEEKRTALNCLLAFYETTLQHSKFRCQREYCLNVLKGIEPAFMEGYLKPIRKQTKTK